MTHASFCPSAQSDDVNTKTSLKHLSNKNGSTSTFFVLPNFSLRQKNLVFD